MPAPLLAVDADRPDPAVVERAAAVLRAGGLVAFPTETVYGLGADATSPEAVARIFAVKARPEDNPLIVHLADAAELPTVARVTPLARTLAERFWPGPLTLVLEADPRVAPASAGLSTVAVRVPDHPVALALLAATALPVAAPSANRSGRPSPTTAAHVMADLGESVALVLDGGPCAVGLESTVVDARGARPVVLREGAITREALGAAAAPAPGQDHARGEADALGAAEAGLPELRHSPGTRHRHYQPACAVEIAPPGDGAARAATLARQGRRTGLVGTAPAPEGVVAIGTFRDAAALAHALYGALRAAEEAGVEVLVIEAVAEEGIGRAVMDRLRRAAGA